MIRIYKAKKTYEKLNDIDAYCIIDRDFRTDGEISALKSDGINFLEVAEVENLFLVPELLDIMEKQLLCDEGTAEEAKKFIYELYVQNKPNQIGEAFIKEVGHQLTLTKFSDTQLTPEDLNLKIHEKFMKENIEKFLADKQTIYNSANTLEEILKIFNFKQLSIKISPKFGLKNEYAKRVINAIKSNKDDAKQQIFEALAKYMPDLP